MSVLRKSAVDNPIFIGPVMFHFDGKAETYRRFFSTLSDLLCGDVYCAEFAGDVELVFGSDDEKAMVAALRQVFQVSSMCFVLGIWRRMFGGFLQTRQACRRGTERECWTDCVRQHVSTLTRLHSVSRC